MVSSVAKLRVPSPHSQLSPAFVISVLIEFLFRSPCCASHLPLCLHSTQSGAAISLPERCPHQSLAPQETGASPAGTEGFGSAGLCTDPGAGIPFSSVATCHSIISEEQTTQLLLSHCHHFPSHTQNVHVAPYLQLRKRERCSREGGRCMLSLGVRTGPCRQADRQIDRRPWDPRLCFLLAVWSSSSVTCWDPCLLTSGLGWCWRLPVCEHRPLPPSLEAVPLLSGL